MVTLFTRVQIQGPKVHSSTFWAYPKAIPPHPELHVVLFRWPDARRNWQCGYGFVTVSGCHHLLHGGLLGVCS
jgi:hypothetical protein